MKILGLDLSLTGTGVAVIEGGKLVTSDLIKSKPSGPRPKDEARRIQGIVDKISEHIDTYSPDLVVIEGIAFMAKNTTALAQLAGLNYLVRALLLNRGIDFIIVAPSTLKKFITGKGNSQKDVMMLETYKQYGLSLLDDNIVDAHGLAQVGHAVNDRDKITKTQMEVVHLVSTQI